MSPGHDPFADLEPLIKRVYAYVAYRIGEGHDADDVTSEVFERALRFRASYDASRGTPAAWLIGIARRCIAARPLVHATAEVDGEGGHRFEDAALGRLALASAMRRLSARDRELLALRYGSDLTAREIGRLLELKTNAVEVALHRALGRLRGELSNDVTVRPTPLARPVETALRRVRVWQPEAIEGAHEPVSARRRPRA